MSTPIPRGWWHYSQLRPWQVVVPLVVGVTALVLDTTASPVFSVLAAFFLGYLVAAVILGSVQAERARRHGCW